MLEIFLACLISIGIIKLFERIFVNHISRKRTQYDIFAIRKKFIRLVSIVVWALFGLALIVLFISFLIIAYALINGLELLNNAFLSLVVIIGSAYLAIKMAKNLIDKQKKQITTLTVSQYLEKHSEFSIFLRSFSDDDYTNENKLSQITSQDSFSESLFVFILAIKENRDICAIGMPEELRAPVGATRVYAETSSWHEEVYSLMEKSYSIYILVDKRPSCLWEISNTKSFLQKTYYLIDDRNDYNAVQQTCDFLPLIPERLSDKNHIMLHFVNGEAVFVPYENSDKSYCNLLGVEFSLVPSRGSIFSFINFKGCLTQIIFILITVLITIVITLLLK